MTADERTELIAKLAALPPRLAELVGLLPPETLLATPIDGEWSVAQIVHHLADSHMVAFIRVKLMLTEDHPPLAPYSQPAFGQTADANHAGVQESLELLAGLHARWVRLLQSLPEEGWARTGYYTHNQNMRTLDDILRTYANHGEAHLEQIRHTLDVWGSR